MATILDTRGKSAGAPRHPEKAHRPDTPILRKPDWIRVKAPGSAGYRETAGIIRAHGLHTVCEEAGCPNIGECWEKKHADHDDHGRHLHPRLRLLQCEDRTARPARSGRAGEGRRCRRQARPGACRDHLGRPRRPGRWRRGAFRRRDPRHPRRIARHHHRSADARFPAQGAARWRLSSRRAPTSSTTIWRRCPRSI